jgi:hypothetical protein
MRFVESPLFLADLLMTHELAQGFMGRFMALSRPLESQNGENSQHSTFNFERLRASNSHAGWRLGVEC